MGRCRFGNRQQFELEDVPHHSSVSALDQVVGRATICASMRGLASRRLHRFSEPTMGSPNMEIKNFGRNVCFSPQDYFEPANEDEVLEILRANRDRQIRTIGRLHSWSEAPKSENVILNLKHLDSVQIHKKSVVVGAGCQLKQLIATLDQAGLALPSQGLITEQTVAGAISTGTHGSGKHSLSHYVEEVTIGAYAATTGEPIVRTIREGAELLAARCSLGCMGVILSIRLHCRPQYHIEEHFRFLNGLPEALEAESEYPIQQFYLLPHSWRFMAQHRRVAEGNPSLLAPVYQAYWYVFVDLCLHLVLISLARFIRRSLPIRKFYQWVVPWTIPRGWRVVDKSHRILTMEHELFRHIEIEVFVARSKLASLLDFARSALEYCDGNRSAVTEATWSQLRDIGLDEALRTQLGEYTHHYPICVRKVLPDATLISMASGHDEPYYAVSFISYSRVGDRIGFLGFARFLARATALLFDARPHWGKVCPIDAELAQRLYPGLPEFRDACERADSGGIFRNAWARELLFHEDGVSTGRL